jgi:ferredoxin
MDARVTKRDTDTHLLLTLRMFLDEVQLRLDRGRCIGCDICALVCPRNAVQVIAGEDDLTVDIDPRLCLLCEVCAHFCPTNAVTLIYNGRPKTIFADNHGLAPFYPKVSHDQGKCLQPCQITPEGEVHWCRREQKLVVNAEDGCPKKCHRCLDICPRQALRLDEAAAQPLPEPDLCLRCTRCLTVCETGALEVTPQFHGELTIDDRLCPPDCLKCINLCPVKAIVREGERVFLKVERCSYCGVCRNICDEAAITLVRRAVVAEPGEFSQAWDRAVAKLVAEA